jgi:alpha-mannosidase/mannosylglycerate hydrolase
MPVGYVTDVFGHVSQTPQIFAGFGFDAIFLHRGTSCHREKSEMVWEGADGTEALLIKIFPDTGYQDFLEYRGAPDGLATTKVLFSLDGNDHQPARWDTPEVIKRFNAIFTRTRPVHSSWPKYLAALKKALPRDWKRRFKRFRGELRTPAREGMWSEVIIGTGSSRVYLKQANDLLEYLLPRVAEPLNAWAVAAGGASMKPYLDRAWRYLLLNHPHDSICACSIDQVHQDMVYRFDQARLLAEETAGAAMQSLSDRIETAGTDGGAKVTVFNCAAESTPVARLSFEVDSATVAGNGKRGLRPVLADNAGREIRAQIIDVERQVRPVPFAESAVEHGVTPRVRPRTRPVDRYYVAAPTEIDALGYRSFSIRFARKTKAPAPPKGVARARADARKGTIENGLVRLAVNGNGTMDLYDRRRRTRYKGLHFFEDCGDAGDGWTHQYPTRDTVILSTRSRHRRRFKVEVIHPGPLLAALRVSFEMRVNEDVVFEGEGARRRRFEEDGAKRRRSRRSRRFVWLPIETVFTITAGSARVDCRTTVLNRARRHRLRVIFPSGRRSDVWYADSAFDVVKRKIRLIDTSGWKEQAREETVIKNFAAVCDRRAGLAVLTKGLNEAAVQDKPSRPIALTLWRSFVEVLNCEPTVDSLLAGPVTTEYALLPFKPERAAPPADIMRQIDLYKLPPLSYSRQSPGESREVDIVPPESPRLRALKRAARPPRPDLPPEGRLLDVEAPVVLSTVKVAEGGRAVVARLWNPTARAVGCVVRPSFRFTRAAKADMLERACGGLRRARGGAVSLKMRGKEIVTVRFDLGG